MEDNSSKGTYKWKHPSEVMKLQKLKQKKKALSARINLNDTTYTRISNNQEPSTLFESIKRKNPFIKSNDTKKQKNNETDEVSQDNTLFKLFAISSGTRDARDRDECHDIIKIPVQEEEEPVQVKSMGEKWIPIDWSLKKRVRFLCEKPLAWNSKLKISEEASGITSFTRCLEADTTTTLDTSSNAKFHQCCLYWQHPSIPWLSLFPRNNGKSSSSTVPLTAQIKESMHTAWVDSIRSLFHLLRTRQCPYFYACTNNFTVVFRAAGLGGFTEINAMVSPTTRGFRQMLKEKEIEFTMPLKTTITSQPDQILENHEEEQEEDEDEADEQWLHSMGVNKEDIKQINYTQEKITRRAESEVDNSSQSLVFIQGVEVQAFYSFLINCKSAISLTGVYAGVPPTLLAPVAYHGATLMSLNVRESKLHLDSEDLYSIDLSGPLLPQTIHNLCLLHPRTDSMTATFNTLEHTENFSRITQRHSDGGSAGTAGSTPLESKQGVDIFNKENLSDCGLKPEILKHFCSNDEKLVSFVECLKYSADNGHYLWT